MRQELGKAIVETQLKYNHTIFGNESRIWEGCLNELRQQQVTDEKVHNQELMENTVREFDLDSLQKNTVMDGNIIIDKHTSEALVLKLIIIIIKRNFKSVL